MADDPRSFYDEVRFHLDLAAQNATTIVLTSGQRYVIDRRDAVAVGTNSVTIFVGDRKQIIFPLIDVSSLEIEVELPEESKHV